MRKAVRYAGQVAHDWLTMPQQAGRAAEAWLWRLAAVLAAYLAVRLARDWFRPSNPQ